MGLTALGDVASGTLPGSAGRFTSGSVAFYPLILSFEPPGYRCGELSR
jgi:hypothetical protein